MGNGAGPRGRTRLVVALHSEAKPLIARFGLRASAEAEGFKLFLGDGIALIVSGIGRIAAAAATAYLQGFLEGGRNCAWVNIGIGGHATETLGGAFLAHRIIEAASGRCWYPSLIIDHSGSTAEVVTVDAPEVDYPMDAVYDMEASGFYPTATRFSTSELVQVVKVVSDNRESSLDQLTPGRIEALIVDRLEVIEAVIERTTALAQEARGLGLEPANFTRVLERWHFTVSERHRLRRLLQRYQVLYPENDDWHHGLVAMRGSDVLHWLQARIAECPVRLG